MKNFIRISIGVILSLVFVYAATVLVVVPKTVKSEITRAVNGNCSSCKFEFASISFDFFDPGRATLRDLRLKQGQAGVSELLARIEKVSVDIDLAKILSARSFQRVELSHVRVHGPGS